MTFSTRHAVLLLVLFTLGACAEPRWLPLQGSNIRARFFGNTARGTDTDGGKWSIWIAADGNAKFRGSNADGSPLSDTGMARIDGDQLCVDWAKMHQDKPFCEVIYDNRTGEAFRAYTSDLVLNAHITVVPGNADNL